jgi:hypothetical protein
VLFLKNSVPLLVMIALSDPWGLSIRGLLEPA